MSEPLSLAQVSPVATAQPCIAHGRHSPHPLYCELHHVIPQAWQGFMRLAATLAGDMTLAASELFDPRTVALCRTGHGNVHYYLVRFMRLYEEHAPDWAGYEKPVAINHAVRLGTTSVRKEHPASTLNREEIGIAKLGMVRWVEAGGDLMRLCKAGLYGVI